MRAVGTTIGVVMAGGYGTRLAEVGVATPKPLQVVGGRTLLSRAVSWLEARFKPVHTVVVAHHRAELIEEAVGKIGLPHVRCVKEETKLGTAGYLTRLACTVPTDTRFVVVNADVVTNWDAFGASEAGCNWLAAVERQVDVPYGSLDLDENTGYLIGVREKWAAYQAAAGIYGLNCGSVRKACPNPLPVDMPALLTAIAAFAPVAVYPLPEGTYWRDIATPACLEKARADFAAGRVKP